MKLGRRDLPSVLSVSRIGFGLIFVAIFSANDRTPFLISTSLLAVGFATDFADGRLARRWNLTTETGYYLDGLGDKALYTAVLLVIGGEDRNQLVLIWALIAREMILYAMRLIDKDRSLNIARLKFFSWCYAFSMWAYFAGFLAFSWFNIQCPGCPTFLSSYSAFGYLALTFGALHLAKLFSVMATSI
jgi:phosphatidylglycerophosphate synthase